MTVAEMINELEKLPDKDAQVLVYDTGYFATGDLCKAAISTFEQYIVIEPTEPVARV